MAAIYEILTWCFQFANIQWDFGNGVKFTYIQLFLYCIFIAAILRFTFKGFLSASQGDQYKGQVK